MFMRAGKCCEIIQFLLNHKSQFYLPVLHGIERLFIGYVVHEDETHGAPVISGCDRSVPLLASSVLNVLTCLLD